MNTNSLLCLGNNLAKEISQKLLILEVVRSPLINAQSKRRTKGFRRILSSIILIILLTMFSLHHAYAEWSKEFLITDIKCHPERSDGACEIHTNPSYGRLCASGSPMVLLTKVHPNGDAALEELTAAMNDGRLVRVKKKNCIPVPFQPPRPLFSEYIINGGPSRTEGDTKEKTAIVLSGGGAKGSFQVGALKRLYELGIRPSILAGTSVGALNAAKLAEDQPDSMHDLECLWLQLKTNKDMWGYQRWFNTARLEIEEINALITDLLNPAPHLLDVFTTSTPLPHVFFGIDKLKTILDKKDTVEEIVEGYERSQSLFNLKPTAEIIKANLSRNDVMNSEIELRVSVTDLVSGALAYVDNRGRLLLNGTRHEVDLHHALLASASIPAYFPPLNMGVHGALFVDGGVREIVPLSVATHDLSADKTFVILASSLRVSPKACLTNTSIETRCKTHDIATRSIDILTKEIVYTDIAIGTSKRDWLDGTSDENGQDVVVIVPKKEIHGFMEVEPELIQANIHYGWMLADDALKTMSSDQRAALGRFATSIVVTLKELWELENFPERHVQRADVEPEQQYSKMIKAFTEAARQSVVSSIQSRQNINGAIPPALLAEFTGAASPPSLTRCPPLRGPSTSDPQFPKVPPDDGEVHPEAP